MRPCPICGANTAETDDFCGNCGSYLGWERPAAEEHPPGPAAEPSAPSEATARIERAEQPAAVQPAKPVAPRPETHTVQPTPTSEGPPCPSCGTPNPPERNFCVRCATPLRTSPERAELPWWRRARKPRDDHRLRWLWRRLAILCLLLALVAGAFLLYPFGQWAVQDVLDKISNADQVTPVKTSSSTELPGHPDDAATDLITNSYWGTPGPGEWIEFEFEEPIRLVEAIFRVGPSEDPVKFRDEAHPSLVEITTTDAEGRTHQQRHQLGGTPEPQHVVIARSAVTKVRVLVLEAGGLTAGKHVALGDVEFFRRA
ncbi:hypothetical protein ACL03H_06095 [Saccharopolyspora sp. MS10]|uniref:hypothetical protein n=1 Tax=Saccharopolyspora sp. MS10 TaxID=3385973 RepID=UPI0039A0E6F8